MPGSAPRPPLSDPHAAGYELALQVPDGPLAIGYPVLLRISLKNIGASPVQFGRRGPARDYEFELTGPDGHPVPLTRLGEQMARVRQAGDAGVVLETLAPNQTRQDEILLNALFDMTLVGTYRVRALRQLPRRSAGDWVTVRSPELVLELPN